MRRYAKHISQSGLLNSLGSWTCQEIGATFVVRATGNQRSAEAMFIDPQAGQVWSGGSSSD
ncbi:MAG: hypothetical protein HY816_13205 [Candidatus Wallbacteria bacterium]|nr:hypothetical protein [Candidatus Wallbacteria bacterium]